MANNQKAVPTILHFQDGIQEKPDRYVRLKENKTPQSGEYIQKYG